MKGTCAKDGGIVGGKPLKRGWDEGTALVRRGKLLSKREEELGKCGKSEGRGADWSTHRRWPVGSVKVRS